LAGVNGGYGGLPEFTVGCSARVEGEKKCGGDFRPAVRWPEESVVVEVRREEGEEDGVAAAVGGDWWLWRFPVE
ncbi:hypothetical protein HAX54_009518, partial [Datura stramonium]|nr:hypothetical protein [Datura stramonium]